MNVFDKSYDGESIVDVGRDVYEAFDESFNPVVKDIPQDRHGISSGIFRVIIGWCENDSPDPSTIQPAEDPRKQMLDEIRKRVSSIKDKAEAASAVKFDMYEILDEMEAKL